MKSSMLGGGRRVCVCEREGFLIGFMDIYMFLSVRVSVCAFVKIKILR